jgi:hypothetical protein
VLKVITTAVAEVRLEVQTKVPAQVRALVGYMAAVAALVGVAKQKIKAAAALFG